MNDDRLGHLVIHRAEGQAFTIGDSIRVEVVFVRNGHCSLRITAPKSIVILRDDIVNDKPKDWHAT